MATREKHGSKDKREWQEKKKWKRRRNLYYLFAQSSNKKKLFKKVERPCLRTPQYLIWDDLFLFSFCSLGIYNCHKTSSFVWSSGFLIVDGTTLTRYSHFCLFSKEQFLTFCPSSYWNKLIRLFCCGVNGSIHPSLWSLRHVANNNIASKKKCSLSCHFESVKVVFKNRVYGQT